MSFRLRLLLLCIVAASIACSGSYRAICTLVGVEVRPPDQPFSLPGISDDSTVTLKASTVIDGAPGHLVGATDLVLSGPGKWTFGDTLYVYRDDTGDTAAFDSPRCKDQDAAVELSLDVRDATGQPVEVSASYPPSDLVLPGSVYPCQEETPWPGVVANVCWDVVKGDN